MYILDSNIISELRKIALNRANHSVIQWFSRIPHEQLYLSAITVMELNIGILRLERRDPAQAKPLRQWFEQYVLPEFSDRTVAVDSEIALCCSQLHVPNPHSERDALIAATAMVHDMTVVTRNIKDFKTTGVSLINPFDTQ